MATAEQLFEEARMLPPEEQLRLREMLENETRTHSQERRDRLAASIRGKYRDVLSSSEELSARKAEEIEMEDRRR